MRAGGEGLFDYHQVLSPVNPHSVDLMSAGLARVRERMENACARAHRDPSSVKLLAVTKVFGPEAIRAGYELGLRVFGENYVQEMERKNPGRRRSHGCALPSDRPSAVQ